MAEAIVFFAVLVGIAVVASIGHGIWIISVEVLRALFDWPPRPGGHEQRRCPFCNLLTRRSQNRCDWCGNNLAGTLAAELDDIDGLTRQLKRLEKAGVIAPAEAVDLVTRAEEYRTRLTTPSLPEPAPKTPQAELVTAELVDEPAGPALPRSVAPPPPPSAAHPAPPPATTQPPAVVPPAPGPRPPVMPKPPAKPTRSRKPWRQVLTAFMEERNIHVAELIGVLVGGLLMVGASIALWISVKETLDAVPLFKFSLFAVYSGAVFGAGLFTHYRWKLDHTSRALLIIATLLVPLNFLAMAREDSWAVLNVAWEAVALGVFGVLVALAAAVIVPRGRWFQVAGVVGGSALVVVLARLSGAESHGSVFLAAGSLPVALFAVVVGAHVFRLGEAGELDADSTIELFTLLGTAAFTSAVALGLLVARAVGAGEAPGTILNRLSVLVALAAAAVLAAGLTIVRGTGRDRSLGPYRAAGTIAALVALGVMLAALAMAWPRPLPLMAVGGFNAAALVFVAFRYRFPIAHAGAVACATLAYLTGYHVLAGNLAVMPDAGAGVEMLRVAGSAESGVALVGLFAVFALAAEILDRWGRRRHAEQYAGGAVVVALISLLVVTVQTLIHRGADAPLATGVYAVYTVGCLLLNLRFRKLLLTYLGLGLAVGATIWALWWTTERLDPIWTTVLAAEALAMGVTALVLRRGLVDPAAAPGDPARQPPGRDQLIEIYRVPLRHAAEVLGLVTLCTAVWSCWHDAAAIQHAPAPVITALCLGALYLLTAWDYRSRERTWFGSMIVLAGLVHAFVLNYTGYLDLPWLDALLAHSTLAVLACVLLEAWGQRRPSTFPVDLVRRVFVGPLGETALLSSALAVAALPLISWQNTISLALCLFWLAGIWLVIAATHRWPVMCAAAQVVLTLAAGVAATAWLQHHPWDPTGRIDLVEPRSLQVYGIGFALLSLLWIGARMGLRRNAVAGQLLNPGWPTVDRIVVHAVVLLQWLLLALHLLPGCLREMVSSPRGPVAVSPSETFGPAAWMLLGLLAAAMLAALWQRWREDEMASSLILLATAPCLVAARFAGQEATASALRWGLAVAMVVGATAIWQRKRLRYWCRRIGAVIDVGRRGPGIGRAAVLATTAGPTVLLTAAASMIQISGTSPGGPAWNSLFFRMGPELSYLVPLAAVTGCLVAFALREASAGYAFSAGLVAKMTVALGYLLMVVTAGGTIGTNEVVTVVQLLAITAAAWAVAWTFGRRWTTAWAETPKPGVAQALMSLQLGIGSLFGALVWSPAVLALVLLPTDWQGWTIAAGSWLGWFALVIVVAAIVYRQLERGRAVAPDMVGLVGMVAIGLLACTVRGLPALVPGVEGLAPEWGYRTLMLGWAVYALLVVLATWWAATQRTLPDAKGPPQALIRAASVWVTVAGLAAVLLGLKAAFFHRLPEELLWAATAIALASAAGAAMSVWRRREGWAFAAAPGVNVAASLVVWYYQRELAFEQWWILLIQANVIAGAAVALIWLAARKRLYRLRDLTLGTSPLLGTQTAIPVGGLLLILTLPVISLLANPAALPGWAGQLAQPPGWIALILTAAAAAWYLRQISPQDVFHTIAGLALGAGVLVACSTTHPGDRLPAGDWLAYHVLVTAFATAGLVVLAAGLLGRDLRLAGQIDPNRPVEGRGGRIVVPASLVQGWVTAIGVAVVALVLIYCARDPDLPWWSARAILAVSVMAGILAVWLRLPSYVCASALLINVAGALVWSTWEAPRTVSGFIHANVLCLGVASCVWSLVRWAHPRGVPPLVLSDRAGSTDELAIPSGLAQLGLVVLAVLVAASAVSSAVGIDHQVTGRLAWLALAAVGVSATMQLWEPRTRFALPGLYFVGLAAVGMALDGRALPPRAFSWNAAPELAGFTLAAVLIGLFLARLKPVWRALRISENQHGWESPWLSGTQAAVASIAAVMSVWIALDAAFDPLTRPGFGWLWGRMAGPLAVAVLLVTATLMAGLSTGRRRGAWQQGTLGLGILLLSELGWAMLPAGDASALNQTVVLMIAAVTSTLIAGFGLGRLLSDENDWLARAKKFVPWSAGLALAALCAVLVQEGFLFDPELGAPMALWAVLVVAGALAALIAVSLAFALDRRRDPFDLSDRGRTVFVYAAEVLGGLVGLHLWLTMPWLFRLGIVEQYWMLMVMAVAFGGAALSELFHRRGLAVLSEPLENTAVLLPLVPAILFWLPIVPEASGLGGASPAVWLLAAVFYGVMAVTRRNKWWFSLLALGSANVALCVLWYQQGIAWTERPQLFLIPVGLSALVAEYLNYDRLTKAQSAGLRYLALSLIYVPSTVEFLGNLGDSLWLPIVLTLLSLLGILAGIVLRVRSFVVLGLTFLVLVIVTLICHAAFAQDRMWILYVFLVALGTAILILSAVFEKRRKEILAAVVRFREWEPRRVGGKDEG